MDARATEPAVLHGRWRLAGPWRATPNGAICRATYRNGRYLVKRLPRRFPGRELAGHPRAWLKRAGAAWSCLALARHMRAALDGRPGAGRASATNLNVAVDVFVQGGRVYKVTPFVEPARRHGERLTCANAHRLLTADQLDTVLRSLAAQLGALRRAHLVHNDLKPQNVLLTEREPGLYVACVIDYDDGFFEGAPPPPDALVGALEYASPELLRYLARGEKDPALAARLTCASDMFSLGVLYYELLCGAQLVDEEWRWPAARIAARLPVDLSALDERHRRVVRAMLNPDPARRPKPADVLRAL